MNTGAHNSEAIIARVLLANGIDSSRHSQFLHPAYEEISDTYKAFNDIDRAVSRVKKAAEKRERVVIYGDFDVDGLTATAIMVRGLKRLGLEPSWYIPDRIKEGHGLNRRSITKLCQKNDLLITVDCAIADHQEAKYGQYLDCDIIITDHHTRDDYLPPAYATLFPPFELNTDFSGAGIAFKFVQALLADVDPEYAKSLLWLACLGTVVDCVAQTGENRVISHLGLKQLNDMTPMCIKAIAVQSDMVRPIDKRQITWKISPRLNSASRLGFTQVAADLLMSDESEVRKIKSLAGDLEIINRDRKETFEDYYQIALERVTDEHECIVVVFDGTSDGDARGIQGLLAARLSEQFNHRPTFVFTDAGNGYLSGSARCPKHEFTKIFTYLTTEAKGLIISGGGHSVVGGMSLFVEDLPEFKTQVDRALQLSALEQKQKAIPLDICDVSKSLYQSLALLEPYGDGDSPLFEIQATLGGKASRMGKAKDHLKFGVIDSKTQNRFEVIAWGMAQMYDHVGPESQGKKVTLHARLVLNSWNGTESIELDANQIILEDGTIYRR